MSSTVTTATDLQTAIAQIDAGNGQNTTYTLNIGPLDLSAANNAYVNIGGIAGSGNITLGSETLTLFDPTYDTYSGVISGSGSVGESGGGTLVLTGQNSFTGSLVLNNGIVQLGDGGTTGSVAGNIVDDAVLQIDLGGTAIFNNLVTGYGSVNLTGSGTVVMTANNLYSGMTTVETGSLQLGNGGTTGSISGAVKVAGPTNTLIFDHSGTFAFSNSISGYGNIEQLGGGTLILEAYDSYSGATTIQSGTLSLEGNGDIQNSSGVNVAANGTFDISSAQSYVQINALTGAAGSTVALGGNTLTVILDGSGVFAGTISGSGGSLTLGNNADTSVGTLTLTGQNSYTGRTVINTGKTLQLGDGGSAPGTLGNITDDSALIFDYTGAYNGTIQGNGTVTVEGGTLDTATKQTFSGQTIVDSTLRLDDGGSISGSVAIAAGGVLAFNHSDRINYGGGSQVISGAGSVEQVGTGTLALSGTNTFTGGVAIGSGTLELTDGAAAGAGAITFTSGDAGTLLMDTSLPTGTIADFGVGDTIDVRSIGLASTATLTAGGLVLASQSGSVTLKLSGVANGGNVTYTLSADGSGGTDVRIDPASVPQMIAFSGAASSYTIVPSTTGSSLLVYASGSATPTTVPDAAQMSFSDGTGFADPTGVAGDVARLYQAAFDRTPDLNGYDYWLAQANDDNVSVSTIATYFASSPEFITETGTGSTNTAFVQALYQNVLGRTADQAGLTFWTGELNTGAMSRGTVLNDFAQSQENIAGTLTMAGNPNTSEVDRLYQAAFNRSPDTAGLGFWTTQLASGATSLQLAQSLVSSAEFQSDFTGDSNAAFVSQLYVHVFGKAGDAAGIQFWTNQMANGATQAQVLLGFADSAQNLQLTAAQTHAGWVFIKS